MVEFDAMEAAKRTDRDNARLVIQAISLFSYFRLRVSCSRSRPHQFDNHSVATAFNGVVEEHDLGKAFEEALPFTSLLVVFFGVVGVIHDQHLFSPVIAYVLSLPEDLQPGMFYIANGLLSAISDNVFVATVYIGEVKQAFTDGLISRTQFDAAVAINTGTNIPSVATQMAELAFLFCSPHRLRL